MQTLNLTASTNTLNRNYSKNSSVLCLCDATDDNFTVYLPEANDVIFKFKKVNSSNKVYLRSMYSNVDNQEYVVLENKNECKTLEYDGSNWWVTSGCGESALLSALFS
jgi:hypothetical protein